MIFFDSWDFPYCSLSNDSSTWCATFLFPELFALGCISRSFRFAGTAPRPERAAARVSRSASSTCITKCASLSLARTHACRRCCTTRTLARAVELTLTMVTPRTVRRRLWLWFWLRPWACSQIMLEFLPLIANALNAKGCEKRLFCAILCQLRNTQKRICVFSQESADLLNDKQHPRACMGRPRQPGQLPRCAQGALKLQLDPIL